jgi:hypothetical protein
VIKITKTEGSSSDYKLLGIEIKFNHPLAESTNLETMEIAIVSKVEGSEEVLTLVKDINFKIKSATMTKNKRKVKIEIELVDKPLSEAVFTILNAKSVFKSKELTVPTSQYAQLDSFPSQERRTDTLWMKEDIITVPDINMFFSSDL